MQHTLNDQNNDKKIGDSGAYANGINEPVTIIELESLVDEDEQTNGNEDKEEEEITRELDLSNPKNSPNAHVAKKNSCSIINLKSDAHGHVGMKSTTNFTSLKNEAHGHVGMKSTTSFTSLKSDSDISAGMKSQPSFSGLKNESVSDLDSLLAHVDKRTRWNIFLVRASHIILFVSALVLFFISFQLSRKKITQLVGQSIPLITAGFGILSFLIFVLGVLANHRAWICGFNMEAVCLTILLLAEAIVICATVFHQYGIFYESDVYWANLSDMGKARVMANWKCCGWLNACDISDKGSIYFEYRHYQNFPCFNATESETMTWMTEVYVIFGSFVLFHTLYMICIIIFQSQRLKRQRQKIVKKGVEKRKFAQITRKNSFARLRHSISLSPHFSPSNVKRRLSRAAALSPKFIHRISVRRNTTNINMMASETYLTRSNHEYAGYSSKPV